MSFSVLIQELITQMSQMSGLALTVVAGGVVTVILVNLNTRNGNKGYSRIENNVDYKNPKIDRRKYGQVDIHFFVRYLEKESMVKGLLNYEGDYVKIDNIHYKRTYKEYHFSSNEILFDKIITGIQKPISQLKEDTVLLQFHDSIHYALASLEELFKNKDIVNIEKEVDSVCELIGEIKKFSDEVDNLANAQAQKLRKDGINNILEKHHTVMEQLTTQVKIFNEVKPVNSNTISIEKKEKEE
jgi:hypothetical protein